MEYKIPSLVISGLRGGSGKTLCTLGIIAALKKKGLKVAPFKKGPDFIDASWLQKTSTYPCRNLDVYLMGKKYTKTSFLSQSKDAHIAVIEGNRGLFDGFDKKGSFSTANLAKLLGAKVLLILDCTKITTTAAALVLGCLKIDPEVPIAGIILNKVAQKRHEKILTEAILYHTKVPVVGVIPKIKDSLMFERHLGLLTPSEHQETDAVIKRSRQIAEAYINLDKILSIAKRNVPLLKSNHILYSESKNLRKKKKEKRLKKVGIICDKAFYFYYPENFESLKKQGAQLIQINTMKDKIIPDLDLLYIGGGFPETQARFLEKNVTFRKSLKKAADSGLPIYAECGGLVYLGKKLTYRDKTFAMAGIFDIHFNFSKKPKGHGYTELEIIKKNPFFKIGTLLKGHEFHYTYPEKVAKITLAAKMKRGFGCDGKKDGLVYKNVFALYTHIHALSIRNWAECLMSTNR